MTSHLMNFANLPGSQLLINYSTIAPTTACVCVLWVCVWGCVVCVCGVWCGVGVVCVCVCGVVVDVCVMCSCVVWCLCVVLWYVVLCVLVCVGWGGCGWVVWWWGVA